MMEHKKSRIRLMIFFRENKYSSFISPVGKDPVMGMKGEHMKTEKQKYD
jgi:hypothetical protein